MEKKVAVINFTGSVGKTTIAAHLLSPRMDDAPVYAIETINETAQSLGVDVEKIDGEKFRDLFRKLVASDAAIIDVGASNVEAFLDGMTRFEDSHLEVDYFVVPVTSGIKEQKETMAMISTLADFGIPPERIKLVFNRVAKDVRDEFGHLCNFVKKEKLCEANEEAAIFENPQFDQFAIKKMTIAAVLADSTDYKAKIVEERKNGADEKKISHYTDMFVLKSAAKSINRNLDAVFTALFA